jgi:hypothetical protein
MQCTEIAMGQHIEIIVPTLKSTGKIDRRHGHEAACRMMISRIHQGQKYQGSKRWKRS